MLCVLQLAEEGAAVEEETTVAACVEEQCKE